MNARHATPLILTALTLVLAACGNKGPLVLPTAPPPQEEPRAKPGEVPVTISNANDPPVAAEPGAKKPLPTPPLENLLPPPATPQDPAKPAADGAKNTQDGGEAKPAEPTPAGQGDG